MLIADLINEVQYMRIGKKTTICLITLDNGFEVIGTSACVKPDEYNYELGKKYSKEDAIRRLEEIDGFLMQEHLHLANIKSQGE